MTVRNRIIRELKWAGKPLTAMMLHALMPGYLLGTIAGELNRMSKDNILIRHLNFGPRGGNGYSLKRPERWHVRTSWSIIMADDDPV
jgi:hypothetical protein